MVGFEAADRQSTKDATNTLRASLTQRSPKTKDGAIESLAFDDVARWRATLDSQPEMICRFMPDATITFVNRAYARQYGCETEDLVGTSILDLFPDEWRAWAEAHIARLCESGQPIIHENTVTLPDGTIRDYQWSDHVVLSPNGTLLELQAVGRDITERRQAEEALRTSEQRFRAMFDLAPIGMAVVDARGYVQRANPALVELLSADADRLVGHSFDGLLLGGPITAYARSALTHEGEGTVQAERRLCADGDRWALLSFSSFDEEALLIQVVDLTERKHFEAELAHRAQHDGLTGLLNRTSLEAGLQRELTRAQAGGEDVAVLFCDVDRFKFINDSLGHQGGDQLLLILAQRLQRSMRTGDLLARFGGDEFVVVHRGTGVAAGAVAQANRLVQHLGEPIVLDGLELTVGLTIGIAVAPGGDGVAPELIRDADLAMYAAKEHERGSVRVCDDELRAAATTRLAQQNALRRAIDRDELVLHLQPIVRSGTHSLAGVEALVRWAHPEHGLLPPGDFLHVAENSGLLRPLGHWVLGEACRQLATLRAEGVVPPSSTVWINISGPELADPELPHRVHQATAQAGLALDDIVLEISERALLDEANGRLDRLAELGITLALDDLGTGRTSAADLVNAPLDIVKIDRSFVLAMEEDLQARAVVLALLQLARAVGARVVAEGVETDAHVVTLEGLGCEFLQGFGIGRPVPRESLARELGAATAR
ncbi:putative bifunctional diguanylate cyclase/phosphodiesterase [Egibacter rhizosphaerae]|uniref:putative bifunctional diguanylate cyclase/phosphodiesterase n=1 Tax=Egibacter rhizosphaerae TaxID=1670831 RepID=UPI0013F14495|nr:EAL domain-containing protein [Egibacter rhizosphaerae]